MIGTAPLCSTCLHKATDNEQFTCTAFPGGIPQQIIRNVLDHRKPVKGDQGIQYKPVQSKVRVRKRTTAPTERED